MALLEVENLTVRFYTGEGTVTAVDNLSYTIDRGEKFGVVGESGAGKSVTALSLMRLIEDPGQIEGGRIRLTDPAIVDSFQEHYSIEELTGEHKHVIDLEALRADHDITALAERLEESDVNPTALTGAGDGAVVDMAKRGDLTMDDFVGYGYATELGIVGPKAFIVTDGSRRYIELMLAPEKAVRRIRGNHIAMIFQDAQTALNPVYTVGEQISETIRHHMGYSDEEARERAIQLLDRVGIPEAEMRYSDYPHEFSGGMQQRAVIAMALSCDPDLLVCDEPTTALDVTIETKILDLIRELAEDFDTAVQFITHDLGVIAELCDRVMVMYAGKPVEKASVEQLYYEPKHPYTAGLMSSIPRIGDRSERLQTIPGTMPDLVELPSGCSFHPRCPYAEEACAQKEPQLLNPESGELTTDPDERSAACLAYSGDLEGELGFEVVVSDPDTEDIAKPMEGQHE